MHVTRTLIRLIFLMSACERLNSAVFQICSFIVRTLMSCIREFREIFQRKSMPCLYLFIEKYKNSDLKELSRFASGLEKDLSAVENAVASPLSNGFVEGTNSKLKMIKRTMYGRCGKELLAAKLILSNG